jgi:hypothetical protein
MLITCVIHGHSNDLSEAKNATRNSKKNPLNRKFAMPFLSKETLSQFSKLSPPFQNAGFNIFPASYFIFSDGIHNLHPYCITVDLKYCA